MLSKGLLSLLSVLLMLGSLVLGLSSGVVLLFLSDVCGGGWVSCGVGCFGVVATLVLMVVTSQGVAILCASMVAF